MLSNQLTDTKAHSMELREWAFCILSAESLEDKLWSPPLLTDHHPGTPFRFSLPARPARMQFQEHRGRKDKLPQSLIISRRDEIIRCLHRFCGHELLAVELMAFALLAFPDAPKHFRRGLANTLKEEQWHVQIYSKRLEELGAKFGDLPQYRHFWAITPHMTTLNHFVSMVHLTLEMANLDFAPHYRNAFAKGGDLASASLMEQILSDEIKHVSFGWNWLRKLKPKEESEWETFNKSLGVLTLRHARGRYFDESTRRAAGLPGEWIDQFKSPTSAEIRGRVNCSSGSVGGS